jgi:hypothetical protein
MALFLSLALLPSISWAYDFSFGSPPTQCGLLDISVLETGAPSSPPYALTLIPIGTFAPSDRVAVINLQFQATNTKYALPWPPGIQFVAMMSDASGVGTGGTKDGYTVGASQVQDCRPSLPLVPDYNLVVDTPPSTQCGLTTVHFAAAGGSVGSPLLYGVVPGGASFQIPVPDNATAGTPFAFPATVKQGSQVILVPGGTAANIGASQPFTIGAPSGTDTCTIPSLPVAAPSPTPTPTPPAPLNVGLVVGLAVGGFFGCLIIIYLIFLLWKRRKERMEAERDRLEQEADIAAYNAKVTRPDNTWVVVDQEDYTMDNLRVLLDGDLRTVYSGDVVRPDSMISHGMASSGIGVYYQDGRRETRRMSASSMNSEEMDMMSPPPGRHRALSMTSGSRSTRTARTARSSGKGGPPPPQRAVNIIMHDDGGAMPPHDPNASETVELPPTYASVGGGTSATGAPRI